MSCYSLIIPVYNRADVVGETLDSVLRQDYRPLQLVLVDDGSIDDSLALLTAWRDQHNGDDFSITVLSQANSGPAAARNLGLAHADGDIVHFLDSDDLLAAGVVARNVAEFRDTGCDVLVGGYRVFGDSSGQIVASYPGSEEDPLEQVLSAKLVLLPLRCALSRELLTRCDPWNVDMNRRPDGTVGGTGEDTLYLGSVLCRARARRGVPYSFGDLRRGRSDGFAQQRNQRNRVICEVALARAAYPLPTLSARSRQLHIRRLIRIATDLMAQHERELASQCLVALLEHKELLSFVDRIRVAVCRLGPGPSRWVRQVARWRHDR